MVNLKKRSTVVPERRLVAFENFAAYLEYSQQLFDLTAAEHEALFDVLVKLQSIGEDPVQTLHECKFNMEEKDCLDMLKFMIQIESMDLETVKKMV